MESPAGMPESPLDQDDAAYPCKGCGEVSRPKSFTPVFVYADRSSSVMQILEEGKAFELAGNRWHIDCFRCNTCGTLLDSDANLLLLGDGSLICNNCTYSCSACGNKIEDLAILTGDQAFCASCFKCRNCKKKIENLRYARTSQGIFCMECHESLMARRRKKSAKNSSRHKQSSNSSMLLDKSLPSLPPSAVHQSALATEDETPPSEAPSETPTELAVPTPPPPPPPPPQKHSSRTESSRMRQRERSPEQERKEVLTLPSTTYKDNRHSTLSLRSDGSPNGDDFFIPMKLDPTPALAPSPMHKNQPFDNQGEAMKPQLTENKPGSRDYFNAKVSSSRKTSNDLEKSHHISRSDSRDNSLPSSPHIAYQEKGREPSSEILDTIRRRKEQGIVGVPNGAPTSIGSDKSRDSLGRTRSNLESDVSGEKFRLQEVPRSRKKSEVPPPSLDTFIAAGISQSAPASATPQMKENHSTTLLPDGTSNVSPRISQDSRGYDKSSTESPVSHYSPVSTQLQNLPQRGDSLGTSSGKQQYTTRKELSTSKLPTTSLFADDGRDHPSSAPPASTGQQSPTALIKMNGGRTISKPMESPTSKTPPPPARARDRPGPGVDPDGETFVSPRVPPQPPLDYHKKRNVSISTLQSESTVNGEAPISPKLPRYSAGGEFSMDEDMVRILGNGDHQDHASFLRRVSHSVRHARSYSDRGIRMSKEQKWPKSPLNSSTAGGFGQEISSPTESSPETREELIWYKNELRRERQKMVEKDQKIAELEAALDGKHSIKQMNTELKEKRSTIVVLDTQKEIVVRELEVLTEHIAAAKKSGEPLDLASMSNTVLRDFAEALQKLKETFTPQIEDLVQKRNELIDEVSTLTQLKDKSFQEFEQLSAKNAQLADLNNQLVHQIQELYKASAVQHPMEQRAPPNGLGIYTHHQKERSNASLDSRDLRPDSQMTGSTIVQEHDAEPATILTAPQVVNIRKGQPKKFNWKKGGQNVAKGVTKGLKGAFTSNDNYKHMRDAQYPEGIPYGALPPNIEPVTGTGPRPAPNDPSRQGFGFFGNPKGKPSGSKGMPNGAAPVPPDVLFGSELEQRAEYEKVNIPGIVTSCIQQVELRGMDIEGIYRKSGGNSQIQLIREGFERHNDFDISDPDLDINAVTSTLKQFFRRLPTPLITYEVYDRLLDSTNTPEPPARIEIMRAAINDTNIMPPRHRDTLEFLVFHLARVVERQADNLMTGLNVAVVFAPTIMRPESLAREMSDTQAKNLAVQFLIENCHAVFLPAEV